MSNPNPVPFAGPGPGYPKGVANGRANGYNHKDFIAALRRNDMSPIDEMCVLYRDPGTPARTKYEILKELMQYMYPKRRMVDVRDDGAARQLNVQWNVSGNVTVGGEPVDQPLPIDITPSD